jgi:hypothetical protein
VPYLLYLLTCLAVAFFGRNKTIGFVGFLLLSLMLTPAAGTLILLCGARHPRAPPG